MATLYVIWNREEKRFEGAPMVFAASADATTHINRLKKSVTRPVSGKSYTYDTVSVTV